MTKEDEWRTGTVKELLNLTDEDEKVIEEQVDFDTNLKEDVKSGKISPESAMHIVKFWDSHGKLYSSTIKAWIAKRMK